MAKVDVKNTKTAVKHFLINYPHLRDSDEKLIATIWKHEVLKLGYKVSEISALSFLKYFSEGNLTNPESIRRTRQKIQEEHVALRGNHYKARKDNETKVKSELHP